MARLARLGRRRPREGARPLPADPAHGTGPGAGRRRPVDGLDAVHQHDPARAGAVVPGRRAPRAAHPGVHPLERGRDGRPGEPPVRGPRRPPVDVRVGGVAVRGRLQPLLPGQGRRRLRRPGLHAGPRRPRHLRPGVPRGPDDRGRPRPVPPGDRRRPAELPAPAAAAGLLGVPDGVDGAGPDQRDRPGALQPVPARPRDRRHEQGEGVVLRRRRRDGRAREHERPVDRRPREPRQPHLRRELQPAAPRRSRARERQDHPGARGDLPRRGVERHQGRLGPRVGRPPRP